VAFASVGRESSPMFPLPQIGACLKSRTRGGLSSSRVRVACPTLWHVSAGGFLIYAVRQVVPETFTALMEQGPALRNSNSHHVNEPFQNHPRMCLDE
jgi:hypothetical protein